MTVRMPIERDTTAMGKLPNFLIIGAQRSGTTALASYLRSHPDVFMPPKKEIHFFDVNFERGTEWYRRQFDDAENQLAVGEASPSYMYREEAVPRIAGLLARARLIAILRNPVDRAYSHFWMNRARGHEPLDFRAALIAEPERLASDDPFARIGKSYLDRGLYLRQLRRVCEHFPRSALHVVLFEDLRSSPTEVYADVCRFLGVTDSFVPANIGAPIGQFLEFRSTTLFKVNRRLPLSLRRIASPLNVRSRSKRYPSMDPKLRTELLTRFHDENRALAEWLGRDLSVWET